MWVTSPEAQLGVHRQIRLHYQYKPECEFLTWVTDLLHFHILLITLKLNIYWTRNISVWPHVACSWSTPKWFTARRRTYKVPIPCPLPDRRTLLMFSGPWRWAPVCVWSNIYTKMDGTILHARITWVSWHIAWKEGRHYGGDKRW